MRPAAAANPLTEFADVLAGATDAKPGGADMMLVVAHPDDETIGFGGHLRRLRRLTIVHVTDGAPRDLRDAGRCGFASADAYAAVIVAMCLAGFGAQRALTRPATA